MKQYFLAFVFSFIALSTMMAPAPASAKWCFYLNGTLQSDGSFFGGFQVTYVTGDVCPATYGGGVGNAGPFGLPTGSIYGIVTTVVSWLLALFGLLGILGFVISGIMYLLAAGDDDMAKRAKKGLTYSIIGIIVGLSGYVIMQAINGLLGGSGGGAY